MRRAVLMRSIALTVVVCFLGVGCAGVMQKPGQAALLCGAGGVAAGAATGAAAGRGDWRAIVIGAAVGGILGATACFAIAEYRNRQVKDFEETRKATSYQPDQGDVVRITQYSIAPAAAAPGNEVAFNATYSVMAPNPDQDISITETRILKVYDPARGGYRELGRAPSQVTVKPGTREADGKFQVRSGVAEGRYLLVFQVAKDGQSDTKELPLVISKSRAVLEAPSSRVAEIKAEGGKTVTSGDGGATAPIPETAPQQAPTAGAPAPTQPLSVMGEQNPKAPPMPSSTPSSATPQPSGPDGKKLAYFVASKVSGRGNLRDGPGLKHKIVGEIREGERYVVIDRFSNAAERSSWYKIRLENGLEAWVAGSLGIEVEE